MTPQNTNHEVLVFTNTYFSKKQFCEKGNDRKPNESFEDQLQRACWNGLVFEILPHFVEHPFQKHSVYTWEVIPGHHFIEVTMGEAPHSPEHSTSINPYLFLFRKNFS